MDKAKLMDAHVQVRRVYNCLGEVKDITLQLMEAVDREDQVSVQMLLAMREEPLHGILQARAALRQQEEELSPEEGKRLREILDGAPARSPEEVALVNQVAANIRLLEQVKEMDKPLNHKISRNKSVYR